MKETGNFEENFKRIGKEVLRHITLIETQGSVSPILKEINLKDLVNLEDLQKKIKEH